MSFPNYFFLHCSSGVWELSGWTRGYARNRGPETCYRNFIQCRPLFLIFAQLSDGRRIFSADLCVRRAPCGRSNRENKKDSEIETRRNPRCMSSVLPAVTCWRGNYSVCQLFSNIYFSVRHLSSSYCRTADGDDETFRSVKQYLYLCNNS